MNSIEQRFIRFIIERYEIVDSKKHVYLKVPYWYLNICFCVIITIQKQLNKSILTQNYEDMMPTYLLHALDTSVKYHIFNNSYFNYRPFTSWNFNVVIIFNQPLDGTAGMFYVLQFHFISLVRHLWHLWQAS